MGFGLPGCAGCTSVCSGFALGLKGGLSDGDLEIGVV